MSRIEWAGSRSSTPSSRQTPGEPPAYGPLYARSAKLEHELQAEGALKPHHRRGTVDRRTVGTGLLAAFSGIPEARHYLYGVHPEMIRPLARALGKSRRSLGQEPLLTYRSVPRIIGAAESSSAGSRVGAGGGSADPRPRLVGGLARNAYVTPEWHALRRVATAKAIRQAYIQALLGRRRRLVADQDVFLSWRWPYARLYPQHRLPAWAVPSVPRPRGIALRRAALARRALAATRKSPIFRANGARAARKPSQAPGKIPDATALGAPAAPRTERQRSGPLPGRTPHAS